MTVEGWMFCVLAAFAPYLLHILTDLWRERRRRRRLYRPHMDDKR